MKKSLMFLSILLLFSAGGLTAHGQLYKTGVGARLGFFNGLTVKHYLHQGRAVEGILSTRWDGIFITGLYEFQRSFPDVNNLEWFYGGGAHIGFWDGRRGPGLYGETHSAVGLDLIIGLEYTFDEVPFSASVDWKPAFNIIGRTGWWGDGVALSVRYTFR